MCAYALKFKVHCRSALGPSASGLPYHITAGGKNKRTIGWQKVNSLINQLIDELKEEDSELWFVKYKLHTIYLGQSTHWELVKKFGLRRILFVRSCLRRILFHKKSGLQRIFSYIIFFNQNAFDLKIVIDIKKTQFVPNIN